MLDVGTQSLFGGGQVAPMPGFRLGLGAAAGAGLGEAEAGHKGAQAAAPPGPGPRRSGRKRRNGAA